MVLYEEIWSHDQGDETFPPGRHINTCTSVLRDENKEESRFVCFVKCAMNVYTHIVQQT